MMNGSVRKALKFIDNDESATVGIHPLTEEVKQALEEKHPAPGNINERSLLDDSDVEFPDPVIFEAIDADAIIMSAKNIDGSGGPTNIEASIWRHFFVLNFMKNSL